MFISPFRRLTSVGTLAVLILLIFGLWYITNPKRMGRLAETLLSNVVGGRVTVRYAHLSLNGTLLLSGVELHADEGAGTTGGPSKSPPFFSADQIEARFDWLSLFSGQLRATQLMAIRPTLALVEDTGTEQWNYEHLRNPQRDNEARPPSHGQGAGLPVILIRDACVLFAEVHDGEIKETSLTYVDGQLTPEPSGLGVYRFQVTQHGQREGSVAAAGGAGPLPAIALPAAALAESGTGTWDVVNSRFNATTGRIQLTDKLKRSLPRMVRKVWEEHGVRGALSDLRVSFDNDDGLVVSLALDHVSLTQSVQPQPSEGAGPAEKFDVPLTDVTGDVSFGITKPSLRLSKLTGKVLTYGFQAQGDFRGMSPESPFDLSVTFNNAVISHDYPALFIAMPIVQNLLQRTGPWGRFDLTVSARRLSWNGRVFFDGAIMCRDAHLRFCHFPYPLDHLRGQILFDNENVTFKDVTAQGDESEVLIAGRVGTSPANPGIDLTVSSNNTVFDDRVFACLPEKFQPLLEQFSLQAHGGFVYKVVREKSAGSHSEPVMTVDVNIDDGRGYMRSLPYRFFGGKGHLFFAADGTTIDHVMLRTGTDTSGTVMLNGVVKHPGGDVLNLRPELQVTADVPVDTALLKLFPASYEGALAAVTLGGRLGFEGTVRRSEDAGDTAVPAQITGELRLKDGSLKMRDGNFTLQDAAASAHISGTALELRTFAAATPEGLHLAAKGTADLAAGSGKFDLSAQGQAIVLPQDPPALLPEMVRGFWTTYKPAGAIDVLASADIVFPNPQPAAPRAAYVVENPSVRVSTRSLTLASADWPQPIGDVSGVLTVAGDKVILQDVRGAAGTLTFELGAAGDLKDGSWSLSGSALAEKTPEKWLAKLPAAMANFLAASKPAGQFKVTLDRLDRVAADKPWTFQGSLEAADLTSTGPLSLGAQRMSIAGKGSLDATASGLDFTGVLAGSRVTVNGKSIDALTANVLAAAADKSLKFSDIDGKVAGGALQGTIVAHLDEHPRYQADLTLTDAELARLMLPPTATDEDRKRIGTGRVSATLAVQQTFGDANGNGADRTGRGDLIVRDGKIYNVPLAMGLMQVATLRLPVARAFDHATMSYYLRDNKVTFERILLESAGINLAGLGTMSLKDTPPTLNLNFITETPNEFYLPVISEFIYFTRKELLLQVQVTGSIDDPKVTPVPLNPIANTLKAILPHHSKEETK